MKELEQALDIFNLIEIESVKSFKGVKESLKRTRVLSLKLEKIFKLFRKLSVKK